MSEEIASIARITFDGRMDWKGQYFDEYNLPIYFHFVHSYFRLLNIMYKVAK